MDSQVVETCHKLKFRGFVLVRKITIWYLEGNDEDDDVFLTTNMVEFVNIKYRLRRNKHAIMQK